MNPRILSIVLAALLLVAPAATALAAAPQPYPVKPAADAYAKIHPVLLKELGELGDERITVAVRLSPLPAWAAESVKGNYRLAIDTLKEWARYTQEPFVDYVKSLGGEVLHRFWIDNVVIVRIKASMIPELASYPGVVEVFENFKVHVLEPVAKHSVEVKPGQEVSSWGIFKINAPDVWAMGYTGEGVRIAVLDTGVDITHPALEGKMFTVDPNDPYYPGGWMEFDDNGNPVCSQPHDTHGHGTHTSGTALGGDTSNILIGVAPGAKLMHGLVLPGGGGTFAQVLAGIEWAVEPFDCNGNPTGYPAHVISMSLGASNYYGNELLPGIKNALLANIIVVAAIGNDGPDTSSNPGNVWGVFGVGATDINDNVAWFSSGEVVNWPDPPSDWPFFDTYPSTYIKPDFSAPGVNITSAVPGGGYEAWDGTSMATPHVSGTVALILEAMGALDFSFPDLPETVYQILNESSVDLGDPGQDTRYGWGRIDAYQAVQIAEQYAKKTGVEGYVFDAVDNSPIPWAQVYVVEVNKTYHVRDNGYFKIPLDPGNYTLVFTAWGYQNKTITVEVILLNGTIIGLVYDVTTGDPIANATVVIEEANLTLYTDENGTFQASVQPGTYTIDVSAEGYYNETVTVSVDENETVVVQIGLQPRANGTIAGYVVDADTGDPIANATVFVYTSAGQVVNYTNAQGYYELHVPAGVYDVHALAPGYQEAVAGNVTVQANQTVVVNFTLQPIPPTVVVVGNVHYYTQPHLAQIVGNLGLPVVEYENASDLVADWAAGNVNPRVVIIDHWSSDRYNLVDFDTVVKPLIQLADEYGVTLIFLDTSYSGYTGAYTLYYYKDSLEALGYPAPDSYVYHYPSASYVMVNVTNTSHALFENVTYDNGTAFYLADLGASSYADYMVFNFTNDNVTVLALVVDSYNNVEGVGVAVWHSPAGAQWLFLASWGESYWMQYIEPGSDGQYSVSTQKVLENAIMLGWEQQPLGGPLSPDTIEAIRPYLEPASKPVKPSLYTYVEVYLERQPYGYVTGKVVDEEGNPIAGAKVSALGTPMSVQTDENGDFTMWLPAGNYTLEITAEAYYPAYVNVTVEVNATVDLGNVTLEEMPKIAILYDYQLGNFLSQNGYYVVSYDDPYQLASDVAAGMYDLVIWAGHYNAPFPSADQFWAVINATLEAKVSVIFLDSYGYNGYGIKALSAYTGDPAVTGYDWGDGYVYIEVLQSHPIMKGFSPGDLVLILNWTGADYAWFDQFSGDVLANIVVGGQTKGAGIGVKVTDVGTKWILLASFVPTQWNDISIFTEDALQIILNAVEYGMLKPVNVTLSKSEAVVGEQVTVYFSGAKPNTTYTVYFDDMPLKNVTSDENGSGTVKITVPLVPGGLHYVRVANYTIGQEGAAPIKVLANVKVYPAETTAPGMVTVEVTGLQPGEAFNVYLDSNWLSKLLADENGAYTGQLNIPLVVSGAHKIKLVLENGTVLAEATIQVTSQLDNINSQLSSLSDKLTSVKGEIISVIQSNADRVVAEVQTAKGDILVKLDRLNTTIAGLIVSSTGEVKAIIDSEMGTLAASLDAINATIMGIVTDELGNVYAILNTSIGQVAAKVDAINASIVDVIVNSKGDIIARLDNGFNQVDVKLGNIQATLDSIKSTLDNVNKAVTEDLPAKLEEAKSQAESARNIGLAAGGIAAVAAVAAAYSIVRRP